MKLTRASGAGNTFLILDNFQHPIFEKSNRAEFVKKACNEIPGFTTDGLIFIEKSIDRSVDFEWDFYNSDGSVAEMCGNAARCVTLYYVLKVNRKTEIKFNTLAGKVEGSILSSSHILKSTERVKVKMPQLKTLAPYDSDIKKLQVKVGDRRIQGCLVSAGVPHFVIEDEPNEQLAKALRKVKDFGENGANITFVQTSPGGFTQAITYERGVEDFTLACGTGAVAAAKYYRTLYPEAIQQTIEMPGGELSVSWENNTNNQEQIFLTGDAQLEFDLDLYDGVIL
jgi:diaminopimelate epimerase